MDLLPWTFTTQRLQGEELLERARDQAHAVTPDVEVEELFEVTEPRTLILRSAEGAHLVVLGPAVVVRCSATCSAPSARASPGAPGARSWCTDPSSRTACTTELSSRSTRPRTRSRCWSTRSTRPACATTTRRALRDGPVRPSSVA